MKLKKYNFNNNKKTYIKKHTCNNLLIEIFLILLALNISNSFPNKKTNQRKNFYIVNKNTEQKDVTFQIKEINKNTFSSTTIFYKLEKNTEIKTIIKSTELNIINDCKNNDKIKDFCPLLVYTYQISSTDGIIKLKDESNKNLFDIHQVYDKLHNKAFLIFSVNNKPLSNLFEIFEFEYNCPMNKSFISLKFSVSLAKKYSTVIKNQINELIQTMRQSNLNVVIEKNNMNDINEESRNIPTDSNINANNYSTINNRQPEYDISTGRKNSSNHNNNNIIKKNTINPEYIPPLETTSNTDNIFPSEKQNNQQSIKSKQELINFFDDIKVDMEEIKKNGIIVLFEDKIDISLILQHFQNLYLIVYANDADEDSPQEKLRMLEDVEVKINNLNFPNCPPVILKSNNEGRFSTFRLYVLEHFQKILYSIEFFHKDYKTWKTNFNAGGYGFSKLIDIGKIVLLKKDYKLEIKNSFNPRIISCIDNQPIEGVSITVFDYAKDFVNEEIKQNTKSKNDKNPKNGNNVSSNVKNVNTAENSSFIEKNIKVFKRAYYRRNKRSKIDNKKGKFFLKNQM